jgi:hypothetical protein
VRFDPPQRQVRAQGLAEAGPGGATSCANHRNNAAVVNCGRCGVFMCDLCRIDSDGQTLCPTCFDRLSAEGSLKSTRFTYRDYGRMAGSLAVLGLVITFVAIVAGPAAVYYGVKGLRQRREMGEGGAQVGIWAAIVLGGLETAGGALLLFFIFRGGMR